MGNQYIDLKNLYIHFFQNKKQDFSGESFFELD